MKDVNKGALIALAGFIFIALVAFIIGKCSPDIPEMPDKDKFENKIDSLNQINEKLSYQIDSLSVMIEDQRVKVRDLNVRVQTELNKNRKLRNQIYHYDELRQIVDDIDLDIEQLENWFAKYFNENPGG